MEITRTPLTLSLSLSLFILRYQTMNTLKHGQPLSLSLTLFEHHTRTPKVIHGNKELEEYKMRSTFLKKMTIDVPHS